MFPILKPKRPCTTVISPFLEVAVKGLTGGIPGDRVPPRALNLMEQAEVSLGNAEMTMALAFIDAWTYRRPFTRTMAHLLILAVSMDALPPSLARSPPWLCSPPPERSSSSYYAGLIPYDRGLQLAAASNASGRTEYRASGRRP